MYATPSAKPSSVKQPCRGRGAYRSGRRHTAQPPKLCGGGAGSFAPKPQARPSHAHTHAHGRRTTDPERVGGVESYVLAVLALVEAVARGHHVLDEVDAAAAR